MVTRTEPAPAPARVKDARPRCVHHWIVQAPQGEKSWGECRKCGRRRRFSNRFDGRDRANNSDLFVESPYTWRASRAGAAEASRLDDALELARRSGLAS